MRQPAVADAADGAGDDDDADAGSSIPESEEQSNLRRAQLASRVLRLWKQGSNTIDEEADDPGVSAERKAREKAANDKAWNMDSAADVRACGWAFSPGSRAVRCHKPTDTCSLVPVCASGR